MKNSFLLLLFCALIFQACQQKVTIGKTTDNSITHQIDFKSDSKSEFFVSKKIQLQTLIPTPFISLSAYIEDTEFQGSFFYRTMKNDTWSNWIRLQKMTEGETKGRLVFLGNEVDEATSHLQFKSNQPTKVNLNIRLYAPGHSKKNGSSQIRSGESACSCDLPDICGRSCWCPTGNCPIDPTPFATAATHIIIHHSAANSTSSDFGAVVRSYWDYHVNSNGWDDIGYNYLIDPNGVIYEGRGDGLQGAHFSCMNGNTVGICMIGNFESATPSAAAIASLENFIAWEACDKSIDPEGMSMHSVAGKVLENISGHRDGNDAPNTCGTTVCPGENLYPLLAGVRTAVAAKACLQDDPTNVDVLLRSESIDVFPNPNRGDFQVLLNDINVENLSVVNSIGRIISQKNKKELLVSNIDLSIVGKGMYFLRFVLEDERVILRKVVVQ